MAIDLNVKHAVYEARCADWLERWDFYRAGRHVLEPGRTVNEHGFAVLDRNTSSSSATASERGRSRSRFERVPLSSYLYSHPRESIEGYSDRCARADHYPLFRSVVDIYVDATLRTPPTRQVDNEDIDPLWLGYWNDVDLHGTSVDGFVRNALQLALVFDYVFAVTDRPAFELPAASREQQLARGERAYSYLVSPLNVPDWCIDERTGEFRWVVTYEPAPDLHTPGERSKASAQWARIWFADHWELYSPRVDAPGQWQIATRGRHAAGRVPVSVLYANRGTAAGAFEADGVLSGLARGDRNLYNLGSLLDEVIYGQAFASLWIPDDEGGAPGPISVGVGIANTYNGANGSPLMLSPPTELIVSMWKLIADKMNALRQLYGVGRGKAEYSKEERSADALEVESRNESNRVAALAEACEVFERALHRDVAAWEGRSESIPQAEYSREVSLRSLSAQLNDAMSLKSLGLPWDALREVIKPLLASLMKEQGRNKESIEAAIRALEKEPEKRPNVPDVSALREDSDAEDDAGTDPGADAEMRPVRG